MKKIYLLAMGVALSLMSATTIWAQAPHVMSQGDHSQASTKSDENEPIMDNENVIALESAPEAGVDQMWLLQLERDAETSEGLWVDYNDNGAVDDGEWITDPGLTKTTFTKNTKISIHGAVKALSCTDSHISKISIKGNKGLFFIDLSSNRLESIDVKNFEKLETLKLFGNKIKEIDLSQNKNLLIVGLGYNDLSTLDVSGSPDLSVLEVGYNTSLKTLDVSKNKALKELVCFDTAIESLDVSNNEELTTLDPTRAKLKKLDVSKNKKLDYFSVAGLGWTEFATSIEGLNDLFAFACFSNALGKEEMQKIVSQLPDRTGKDPGVIWVVDTKTNDPVEHNVCTKSQVKAIVDKNYVVFDFRDFENDGLNEYAGVDDEDTAISSLEKSELQVFVDATTHEVRVQFPENKVGKIARVFDMTGRIVYTQMVEHAEMLLQLDKLQHGQYLLFVDGEATLFTL